MKILEQRPCWLQLDSVEYLLSQNDNGETHFSDPTWLNFFYQFLTQPSNTRIVLTSQALPTDLVHRCLRYDNLWHDFSLVGLECDRWLDLFRNYGVTSQTDEDAQHLYAIADYFEGHPLILKMIAGDIGERPFNGDVNKYWQEYYSQRQSQLAPRLRQSQEQRAHAWVSQTIQALPDIPRQMLQYCAVFRRPVPKTFYCAMLPEVAPTDADGALMLLKDRNLVEEHDIQVGQFWLRQHNLIREVAYRNLRSDRSVWEAAERQAADLWLNAYKPITDASNLETVRGYLEAFDHYCEIEDWEQAEATSRVRVTFSGILYELHDQLGLWGYYKEQIHLYERLLNKANEKQDFICYIGLACAFDAQGKYENALKAARSSWLVALQLEDQEKQLIALSGLGKIFISLGAFKDAVEIYRTCIKLVDYQKDPGRLRAIFGNLGIAYVGLGNLEFAAQLFEADFLLTLKKNEYLELGKVVNNRGFVLLKSNQNLDKALSCFKLAEDWARKTGDKDLTARVYKNLAELYQANGEIETAQQYCQQALALATELDIPLKEECLWLMKKLKTGGG